jgi:hypothetical protein
MARILKVGAAGLAFLLYVWFAGVRNLDRVKARKRSRESI